MKSIYNLAFFKFIINIFSIGIYQAVNLLILIVLVPFYIKYYGIEQFGIINLSQAFGLYILAICDYNFLVKGVREISQNINNPSLIGKIFKEALISKIILFLLGTTLGLIIICIVPNFHKYWLDLLIGMLYGLSISILPVWLLQGIQYTQPLAFIHAPIRLIGVCIIFLFFRLSTDYFWVNVILCTTNFIASGIIILFLTKKSKLKFDINYSFQNILNNFKIGHKVCLANISTNTYMNLNTIFLAFFASTEAVGVYSIAEKAIIGFRQILSILASVIYPVVCKKIKESKLVFSQFIRKTGLYLLIGYILIAITLFLLKDFIIPFLANSSTQSEIDTSKFIFIILIFSLPIVSLNVPFSLVMNSLEKESSVSNIAICTAIISIILNVFFSYFLHEIGTAISVLLTELFFTLTIIYVFFRYKYIKLQFK